MIALCLAPDDSMNEPLTGYAVAAEMLRLAPKDQQATPGPWRVTTHQPSGLLKVESADRVICDGFSGEYGNALLIASAPCMLAALKLIRPSNLPVITRLAVESAITAAEKGAA